MIARRENVTLHIFKLLYYPRLYLTRALFMQYVYLWPHRGRIYVNLSSREDQWPHRGQKILYRNELSLLIGQVNSKIPQGYTIALVHSFHQLPSLYPGLKPRAKWKILFNSSPTFGYDPSFANFATLFIGLAQFNFINSIF